MRYGAAHTNGLYNYPNDGHQFTNGCNAIWNLGLRTLKVYCTADYLTNYPLQSAWSSTPTSLTELVQTAEFSTQLARGWDSVIMTVFTFANGSTNWWRVDATNSRLNAEYDEIYDLTVHLLTTYNDSGIKFVLQNWEGDWAYLDAFDPDTFVDRKHTEFYAAFAATRQKAVHDAVRDTAHSNVSVRMAFEVNRVLDVKDAPAKVRILNTLSRRFVPDIVSYSAYDSTIVATGWGSNQADWENKCTVQFTKALNLIKHYWPGVAIQIGEFGFPENEATEHTNDVRLMIRKVRDIALSAGVESLIYWEVFDNEPSIPYTYRGYWLLKPDGSQSIAGAAFAEFALGG